MSFTLADYVTLVLLLPYFLCYDIYNLMIEKLNEKDSKEDENDAATSIFKEVLGFIFGYAQGTEHSIIHKPSPLIQKNKAFVRLTQEC